MSAPIPHHQNNFTFLRHLAAFLVLYAHCITVNGQEEFIFRLTDKRLELSSFGVKIFFIISGYLVTNSLLESKSGFDFVRKRLLRLWPALIAVTFLLAIVAGPILSNLTVSAYFKNSQTWLFLVRNILFLPVYYLPGVLNGQAVNSTFWSIFFEVVCYAILIMLSKHFLVQKKNWLAISWVPVVIWKYAVPPFFRWPHFLHQYAYGISDMMFLFYSASIWLLLSKGKDFSSRKIYLGALVFFLLSLIPGLPFELSLFLQDASLIFLVTQWGKAKAVFKWPRWDISYGTYLLAFPIEMIVLHHTKANIHGSKMIFLVTLLITIPLAFGCWYLVEKPALRAK